MKINIILACLCLCGCYSSKKDIPRKKLLPDLPKHFLMPTSPPKYNVQINPVPFPFNMTGSYVVWVNNERVHLDKKQLDTLVSKLNLSTEKPKDTAEIHNGEGWLKPFGSSESRLSFPQ
jgi:hypothetical protein